MKQKLTQKMLKEYTASLLVWMYCHGYFPENEIDHKDRIRDNNRISNLREASHSCNMNNRSIMRNNTSGVTGVTFHKSEGKWQPTIRAGGKTHYLGRHKDFCEAVCHRLAAEQCLGLDGCNSNSSAYMYVKKYIGVPVITEFMGEL